jgi:methionine-rich copper-binding protein CopC
VSRNAVELRWDEGSGALFYTVQIVDPKGDVVWEGRTEDTHLTVPAAAPLVPGQPYFAWVLAHLRSGATVSSPALGFRLALE